MKTVSIRPVDIQKNWVVVDATDQPVGRLASRIAEVLRGKHKASFVPHLDCGDNVVVINVEKIKFTGNKMRDKFYYRHSGYIGGIKAVRASDLLNKYPERILKYAVKGMLPHNKLNNRVINNLKIYAGSEHPHAAQNPTPLNLSRIAKGE